MSEIISKLFIATILLTIIPVVSAGGCDCTEAPIIPVNYGTQIIIDGYYVDDWNLNTDYVGPMHNSGDENKAKFGDVYAQYDCEKQILYVLVLVDGKIIDDFSSENQFVKLGCGGGGVLVDASDDNDGTPPDFEYINNTNGDKVGWEASMYVIADVGSCNIYDFNVHTQVIPDQTSAFINRCIKLDICCPIPEFSTIALPIAAIIGIMFILQSRRRKED